MATDMFLVLSNGIKGESVDKNFKDAIEIMSMQWALSQPGTMHSSTGGGAGKALFQDVTITKKVDLSSTALMLAVAHGQHIDKAVISLRKAGEKNNSLVFLEITLEELLVSNYSVSDALGSDVPMESVSFNFRKIKTVYHRQDTKSGGSAGKVEMTWNIAANAEA